MKLTQKKIVGAVDVFVQCVHKINVCVGILNEILRKLMYYLVHRRLFCIKTFFYNLEKVDRHSTIRYHMDNFWEGRIDTVLVNACCTGLKTLHIMSKKFSSKSPLFLLAV
jgi:hypothetical protein